MKEVDLPRPEIILTIESIVAEKNVSKEVIFDAVETAIVKIARAKYGFDNDIIVHIDRGNGAISVYKRITVVDDDFVNQVDEEGLPLFSEMKHITISDMKKKNPDAKVGDVIETWLPSLIFGRSQFQSVRQIVLQKIKSAEKDNQYEEFKNKVGEIVSCTVKRVEFGNVYVDINGKAEGYLRRDELIPREILRSGDRIRAYILDVQRDNVGPQILLSRSHPNFMAKLFAAEIPEVYEGLIEVKAVARDPGSHAKVAVFTADPAVDPVGACVGMKGSRIQAIVNELQGEKIDVIEWSDDVVKLAVNAISPATVAKIIIDEDQKHIDIWVAEDQLSVAIGRRGQNVKLASMITGWKLDVLNAKEQEQKRADEDKLKIDQFMEALDVDDMVARMLVAEGFNSLEELTLVDESEIASVEGFDSNLAKELQQRANAFVSKEKEETAKKLQSSGASSDLIDFNILTSKQKLLLLDSGIKTLDDLADLDTDELKDILNIQQKDAENIIMKAREHWFNESK